MASSTTNNITKINHPQQLLIHDIKPSSNSHHHHHHHHKRPVTPTNYSTSFIPFHSPNSAHLLIINSRPTSPVPRDDIIEGMSLSTSSIFERDVEHFEASLTAQEAIQLAVPPVLDEAIQVLATVPTEQILVDQIPLRVHLFNPTSSPLSLDSASSSPVKQSTPSIRPSISTNSNQFVLYQTSPVSSSSSAAHQRARSIPSYPFPTSSESTQSTCINSSTSPFRDGAPPSPIPRFNRQPMSCTSDTASISDPSSPRSLSPTPSFMVGRSMFTQLADHDPTSTPILTHAIPPLSEISSISLNKNSAFNPSTPTQPATDINSPVRQRKTCISFMSYVDVLNSERAALDSSNLPEAVPDLTGSPAPLSSALNALRLARKSTSSLVKRASSIFSHPRHLRGASLTTSNNNLRNVSIGGGWLDRSRCTSTNSNYHSCPTHQPTIDENEQILPLSHPLHDEAEVLSDVDLN